MSLLYAEIPLVLVWDRVFRRTRLRLHQGAGVALILLGVALGSRLKAAARRGDGAGERTGLLVRLPDPPARGRRALGVAN